MNKIIIHYIFVTFIVIHCGSPRVPSNGFIYSPCTTHYGSQCIVGCNDGYFTNNYMLTCDANGNWQTTNVSCKGIVKN